MNNLLEDLKARTEERDMEKRKFFGLHSNVPLLDGVLFQRIKLVAIIERPKMLKECAFVWTPIKRPHVGIRPLRKKQRGEYARRTDVATVPGVWGFRCGHESRYESLRILSRVRDVRPLRSKGRRGICCQTMERPAPSAGVGG